MRKRLQLKWMLTASTLLATSFTLNNAVFAAEWEGTSRGIPATEEHGRTIYVNDAPAKERSAAAPQLRRSNLIYWSSKENRWKAVPSAKTESGRAACSAAAEVNEFYERDSVQSSNAKILQANSHRHQATPEEIDRSIVMAAARHNVDPNLVRAVIKVEWNSNCNAISRKSAMELIELMPKTPCELNVKDPFNPEQNADAGVRHLKYLLEKCNRDMNLTLAGSNAGEAAVRRSAGRSARCRNPGLRAQGHAPLLRGIDLLQSGANRDPVHVQRDGRGVLYISNTE
jgi:soluble lytic murein transglycosylase-like protein